MDCTKKYFGVAEMTEMVNEIYDLLGRAKEITRELITANVRNEFTLRYASDAPEVKADDRPISLEERIEEARKYQRAFEDLRGMITRAEAHIARKY